MLGTVKSAHNPCSTPQYWLYDIAGGFAHTGHNDFKTALFVYVLTNIWYAMKPTHAAILSWPQVKESLFEAACFLVVALSVFDWWSPVYMLTDV